MQTERSPSVSAAVLANRGRQRFLSLPNLSVTLLTWQHAEDGIQSGISLRRGARYDQQVIDGESFVAHFLLGRSRC